MMTNMLRDLVFSQNWLMTSTFKLKNLGCLRWN